MDTDVFNHALKILKERKKDFKKEIEFVDDEIEILKKTYIQENSQCNLYEVIKHIPDDKYYNVLSRKINRQGEIVYDIGEIHETGKEKIHITDVNEYKIIKERNNDDKR